MKRCRDVDVGPTAVRADGSAFYVKTPPFAVLPQPLPHEPLLPNQEFDGPGKRGQRGEEWERLSTGAVEGLERISVEMIGWAAEGSRCQEC